MKLLSDLGGPPTFITDSSSLPCCNGLAKIERDPLDISISTDFPTSFQQNKYYNFDTLHYPLFDALTVEFDHSRNSAVLWVLQMTTSPSHEDSPLGYQVIRKIVAALKKQILDTPPPRKVQKTGDNRTALGSVVRYILVTPGANGDPV